MISGSGLVIASAVTDITGRFFVDFLPPGTYFARTVNDRGFVDEVFDNQLCATCDPRLGTPIVVTTGTDVTGIDFALATGGLISGSIIDTAGFSVAGVPVSIFDSVGTLVGRRRSSTFGQFHISLPAGSYRARAEATTMHGAEVYSELPCTSASCEPAAGAAIPVAAGAMTSGIDFTLTSCSAMTLSPHLLATGVVGVSFRQVFSATGGVGPFAFDVTDGALPQGLTLDRSSGVLSGVPAIQGRHAFRVAVVGSNGCATANAYTLDVQECTYRMSPTSVSVPAAATTVLLTITDACGPLPATGPTSDFMHVQSGPLGQLSFLIDANTSSAPRTGTAIIGRRVLTVRQAGLGSQPPFGMLEVPPNGAQVSGAVGVGGWALDDLEVARVQIYRDAVGSEPPGPVFLGNAVFIPGARPDVATAYPAMPLNDRAGFGFMILTNMLPNQGDGSFVIHAVAEDAEGARVLLGSRTIVSNNASSSAPFGSIDTPDQGATIAGSSYLNWGWALTSQPGMIPVDGSTIQVIVDGAPVGNPTYNLFRPDVSGLFPGLANAAGPVGYRVIDTTGLSEGLHTISWTVTDDRPATSGIGSRYFTVANSADALPPAQEGLTASAAVENSVERGVTPIGVPAAPDVDRHAGSVAALPLAGARVLKLAPMEQLELVLGDASGCQGTWAGYLVKEGVLSDLPVGASLDRAGTFYWQPGPGFAGRFDLLFIRTDCNGQKQRHPVTVTIPNR
jgi:hypothetical protein